MKTGFRKAAADFFAFLAVGFLASVLLAPILDTPIVTSVTFLSVCIACGCMSMILRCLGRNAMPTGRY